MDSIKALIETLERGLNKLRAEASRGQVTSREVFNLTDPLMDALARALSAQGEAAQPAAEGWQDADTAPQTGFFLAWSPDFPDMVSCWKAEIFHEARKMGTPKHLSANHFTKWMPCPLPAASQGGAE